MTRLLRHLLILAVVVFASGLTSASVFAQWGTGSNRCYTAPAHRRYGRPHNVYYYTPFYVVGSNTCTSGPPYYWTPAPSYGRSEGYALQNSGGAAVYPSAQSYGGSAGFPGTYGGSTTVQSPTYGAPGYGGSTGYWTVPAPAAGTAPSTPYRSSSPVPNNYPVAPRAPSPGPNVSPPAARPVSPPAARPAGRPPGQ
jgi:hypothetical protein